MPTVLPKSARLLKWTGSKWLEADDVVARIRGYAETLPEGVVPVMVEPMCGSAAVSLHAAATVRLASGAEMPQILVDANPILINLYRQLRTDWREVHDTYAGFVVANPKYSQEAFNAAREAMQSEDYLLAAAMTVYVNRACYNGLWRTNKAGHFNVPFVKTLAGKPVKVVPEETWLLWGEYLKDMVRGVYCADVQQFLDSPFMPRRPGVLYLDPPYPGTFTGYQGDADEVDCDLLACKARAWRDEDPGTRLVLASLPDDTRVAEAWSPWCDVVPMYRSSQMGARTTGGHDDLKQVLAVSRRGQ